MTQMGPGSQVGAGHASIPLSTLIDYMVQRTYHDLTILSELLPRKNDMERKIEIVQFASRTRNLFVRLLALVKWASSASKVDKCGRISSFLDNQAMLFVETADMLSKMARETLVHARLPTFSLPCAIDVLTTGSYRRLPSCIKERIVPPDPITFSEKQQTLRRLNQIIEHRLVTSELPPLMRKLKIENGRVKFFVEHEFSVTLTLMGDGTVIPWRLLDIEIVVEDPETGDGKSLVHPLQVNYIHQLVQSRLDRDSERPLLDLYSCLHSFCQSLQLEVLYSQATRLIHQRLRDFLKIEEYNAGKSLVLSYWRDPSRRDGRLFPGALHKLSIHVDENEPSHPLQLTHHPQIQGSENIKVAQAIKSDHLSVEKLLMHTIQVRSTAKLKDLEREMRLYIPGPCEIKELPSVLYVPVVYPCMEKERLCITVDLLKGTFLASLGDIENDLTDDVEKCLNGDHRDLKKLLTYMRLWIGLRRCELSVQHFLTPCEEKLPLIGTEGHPLSKLSHNKLFIRVPKQTTYYLVVEVEESEMKGIHYKHYLLQVSASVFDAAGEEVQVDEEQPQQAYMRPGHLLQLDTFLCTHGIRSALFELEEEVNPTVKKRKLLYGDGRSLAKKLKASPCFVPEISTILAMCSDKIPFFQLANELQKRNIQHQGIQVDDKSTGMTLSLIGAPPCPDLGKDMLAALKNDLLSIKFHLQRKGWIAEIVMTNCTIRSTNSLEQEDIHRVYLCFDPNGVETIDKTVQNFLDEWHAMAQLYAAVKLFSEVFNDDQFLQSSLDIKSYNYKKLVLAYTPKKFFTVTVQYNTADRQFLLSFGTTGTAPMANPHTLVHTQLQRQLNQTSSIATLAQVLTETWSPLAAISKLSTNPVLGAVEKPAQLSPTFTFLPQSPTHVRVIMRNTYCLDIHCRGNRIVAIRDGAYSNFDTSKVVPVLCPIPAFKSFLNLFVDEHVTASQTRRRSTAEDDNPPSPVGIDSMDFMSQPSSIGSPASRGKQEGLRFQSPMTPPSNPHTPASPSTRMSNNPVAPSPSSALMGIPSPGPMMSHESPGNPSLHVPSPSSSFVPAPSPSALGIHMPSPATSFISPQGMVEGGSPYPSNMPLTMPSPGHRPWPASPSPAASRHPAYSSVQSPSPGYAAMQSPQNSMGMAGGVLSPPSRSLPSRSWAASVPTLLSHEAVHKLLTPTTKMTSDVPCCPLERFLGCINVRRHIQRFIQSEDGIQGIQSAESGVVMFRTDTLQFRLALNTTVLPSLSLKATATTEYASQWDNEDLKILENFFETKVASHPYKVNPANAFCRLITAPIRVLRDCIHIMKLEMMPEPGVKWSVQWCLTIPHGIPINATAGTVGVLVKGKILIVLQLTRLNVPAPPGLENQTVFVPLVYEPSNNSVQLMEQRLVNNTPQSQTSSAIINTLQRFVRHNNSPNVCSLFPAVRELVNNLIVPM